MILCSSGVFFHPQTDEIDAILSFGSELRVDGLEVLVTRRMFSRLADAAEQLGRTALRFPVVHAPKRLGAAIPAPEAIEQLEEIVRFAAQIGASLVVLHLWDLPESDTDLEGRLAAAVIATDIVARQGLKLAIETIPCHHGTPLRNIERILEHEPRVGVTLDTEFLALHDELDAAMQADWLWADGHVRHVHLKDFDGGLFHASGARRYLLPGEGTLNFRGLFPALENRRFAGSVALEAPAFQPDGQPDVERLNGVLARISRSPWSFR
jgi:sugar phosphate isomerase/epimerase